jgi:ATP-dependent DNA ligase
VERKVALRKILRHGRGIQYVEHAQGHGDRLFAAACKLGHIAPAWFATSI